jgi:hypothetical protein
MMETTTSESVSRDQQQTGKTARHADLPVFFRASLQHSSLPNLKEQCRRDDAAINFEKDEQKMTVEIKSVDVGRLKTLAEKANREHSQAQGAAGRAVQHAVGHGSPPIYIGRARSLAAEIELFSVLFPE